MARELIRDGLANMSSLIALGFVVIGFVFEIVRDRTDETFGDLFRATKMILTLSFSVCSLIFMILLNGVKEIIPNYVVINLALLSVIVNCGAVLLIAYLLFSILKFLNPDKIREMSQRKLKRSAELLLFREALANQSRKLLNDIFDSVGFSKYTFLPISTTPQPILNSQLITTKSKVTKYLLDVDLRLMRRHLLMIKNRTMLPSQCRYAEVYYMKRFEPNAPLLSHPTLVWPSPWFGATYRLCLLLTSKSSHEELFDLERNRLRRKLLRASEIADVLEIDNQLSQIDLLYSIYYLSR